MRITPIGSGSQGNSLLVTSGEERILIDVGFEREELEARLTSIDVTPKSITAVCLTHRHRDHRLGVADFCKEYRVPVHGSRRTLRSLCNKLTKQMYFVEPSRPFRIGHVTVTAVELSHDAPQTVGYVFDDGVGRYGHATDLGCADGAIRDVFVQLDALLLEFNYDPEMLANGPYYQQLRERIASDRGHLSNGQATELLASLDRTRLKHVFIGHVSQKNNTPELALAAAQSALPGFDGTIELARQSECTAPFEIESQTTSA